MTIDNATGLPELPKGHFWRVERAASLNEYDYWFWDGYRVSLRRKLLLGSRTVDHSGHFQNLNDVVRQAEWILTRRALADAKRIEAARLQEAKRQEEARVLGDYPPKR